MNLFSLLYLYHILLGFLHSNNALRRLKLTDYEIIYYATTPTLLLSVISK